MSEIDPDFLEVFLDEAQEILEDWESACLAAESDPSDQNLNSLFRAAHNLKGSSRSVGLEAFGSFLHKIEDVIDLFRNHSLTIGPNEIGFLLETQTLLVDWVKELRENHAFEPDTKKLLQIATEYLIKGQSAEAGDSDSSGGKANDGFQLFGSDEPEDAPAPTPSTSSTDIGSVLISQNKVTEEQVEAAVTEQNRRLGEVLVDQGAVSPDDVQQALKTQKKSGHKPDESMRIPAAKIDELLRAVGAVSLQNEIVFQSKKTNSLDSQICASAIDLVHKGLKELQDAAFSLRMQSVDVLFKRLERTGKDVARKQEKSVHIDIQGTDVELDKTVLERVKDPLVHIIRNAIDHGIEDVPTRKETGKPLPAKVKLTTINKVNSVSIVIADDGRGLARDKIYKKAVDKGLVKPGDELTDSQVHNLILLPGFSTAETITNISGRGVGMDVVKNSVEELGGEIFIESVEGEGTTFTITLPTSLGIIEALIVRICDEAYAVPLTEILEVLDLEDHEITLSDNRRQMFNLRDEVVPIEKLSNYIHVKNKGKEQDSNLVMIVGKEGSKLALVFERMTGIQTVVTHEVPDGYEGYKGVSSMTILSDGKPGLVLSLNDICKDYFSSFDWSNAS